MTDFETCDDTHIHIRTCEMADDECFRLYGTDSIECHDTLWPRWLAFYDKFAKQLISSVREAPSND